MKKHSEIKFILIIIISLKFITLSQAFNYDYNNITNTFNQQNSCAISGTKITITPIEALYSKDLNGFIITHLLVKNVSKSCVGYTYKITIDRTDLPLIQLSGLIPEVISKNNSMVISTNSKVKTGNIEGYYLYITESP